MSNQVPEATELLQQIVPADLRKPTVRMNYQGSNKTDLAIEKEYLRHRSYAALWQIWLAKILRLCPILFISLDIKLTVDSHGRQKFIVTMELMPFGF